MAEKELIHRLRTAQQAWSQSPMSERCRILKQFRHLLVSSQQELSAQILLPQRKVVETLVAEVLPLAEACRYLEMTAPQQLSPRQLAGRGQPMWMPGSRVWEVRQPRGIVLVIGPSNYPLLLPGVQMLQGLIAGNAIVLKPGRLAKGVSELLKQLLVDSGFPKELIHVTGEGNEEVAEIIQHRPDFVVMTGSVAGGRAVMRLASEQLIPCTLELSGCDAMYLLPDADLQLAAKCLAFGLMINGGATCMAPRRVFCPQGKLSDLLNQFCREVNLRGGQCDVDPFNARNAIDQLEKAVASGAQVLSGSWSELESWQPVLLGNVPANAQVLQSDLFVPAASVIEYRSTQELLEADQNSDHALAASIFGGEKSAREFAQRLTAGCVVINDLIAPTADPRVAFGGNRSSGYGRTRGVAGLLEMTTLQVIIAPKGRWKPHLDVANSEELLSGLAKWCHGHGITARNGLWQILNNLWKK